MTSPQNKFTKPPLSVDDQVNLLIKRGLVFDNIETARHYLQFIGYYRLSAYSLPFQVSSSSHQFQENTTFEQILELYIFDRKLRLLVMDAIERIEVAVKAVISNTASVKYNAHWFLDNNLFDALFRHQQFLDEIKNSIGYHSQEKKEVFINHYYQKYTYPDFPPSWMVFELLSLGTVSLVYKFIDLNLKKEIAQIFSIHYSILESWLHSLSYLRNICAHHGRLWNRIFTIKPKIPKNFNQYISKTENNRLFAQFFIIVRLLKNIAQESHWIDHFQQLSQDYSSIDLKKMGFPPNWQILPIR